MFETLLRLMASVLTAVWKGTVNSFLQQLRWAEHTRNKQDDWTWSGVSTQLTSVTAVLSVWRGFLKFVEGKLRVTCSTSSLHCKKLSLFPFISFWDFRQPCSLQTLRLRLMFSRQAAFSAKQLLFVTSASSQCQSLLWPTLCGSWLRERSWLLHSKRWPCSAQ